MSGGTLGVGDGAARARVAAEWRRHYMLPIAGAFGYATGVLHLYGFGPYIQPVSQSFGWSRMETTAGLTIALLIQAVLAIPMGALVDRYGPRPFGLAGILLMTGSFTLLATATGGIFNWYGLWLFVGIVSLPAQSMVWTSAVVACFDRSRGLALAITMCGASLATAIFPLMATWLIETRGWRTALVLHGAIWAMVAFPMIYFFLRGERDPSPRAPKRSALGKSDMTMLDGFRSSIYLRLIAATACFGLSITSFVVLFVPILINRGANSMAAAGIASLVGVAAIVGRLTTGFLLDRIRASLVGAVAFLMPMISCFLLLIGGDGSFLPSLAAILVGLTLGAEVDVLAYLTTRYFAMDKFGALFGGQLMAVGLGTGMGPLIASAIFDYSKSYTPFLAMIMIAMLVSSICLASLPRPLARLQVS